MKKFGFCFLLLCFSMAVFAQDSYVQNYKKFDGLALTPPMGWNSWNKFGCNVDEKLIRGVADAMVRTGMKDAGYTYINIDDCWHGNRDSLGFIHPDSKRFPSGMKALADYIHAKGLKMGIYSDAGAQTCGGKPGSRGFEFQDAQMYAQWGVDYLKYDWCNTEGLKAEGAYKTITAALRKAGHPVVLSICEWGSDVPWTWGQNVGHLWRTTGDIHNCFDCIEDHGSYKNWGVMPIVDKQEGLRRYAGPGHWNDPDMLEVGNGMAVNEDRAHFSIWCMLAAPLIAGNDIKTMSSETAAILLNNEVIAVNQDSLGIEGFKQTMRDSVEVWVKPLVHNDWAVCFLNRSHTPKSINWAWGFEKVRDTVFNKTLDENTTYALRNLWTKREAGDTKKALNATVPPHDVLMFRLTPATPKSTGRKR